MDRQIIKTIDTNGNGWVWGGAQGAENDQMETHSVVDEMSQNIRCELAGLNERSVCISTKVDTGDNKT